MPDKSIIEHTEECQICMDIVVSKTTCTQLLCDHLICNVCFDTIAWDKFLLSEHYNMIDSITLTNLSIIKTLVPGLIIMLIGSEILHFKTSADMLTNLIVWINNNKITNIQDIYNNIDDMILHMDMKLFPSIRLKSIIIKKLNK